MRRSRASIFALCAIAFATPTQAQNRIGGIIGVNRTNISWEIMDFSPRTTFAIGGVLHYRLGESLALQFQPMYLQKGGKYGFDDEVFGHVEFVSKLSYIEIPALFKYSLLSKGATRPFVLAGPTAGILLTSKTETKVAGETSITDNTDKTQTLDLGVAIGAGLSFALDNKEVFFEGRYDHGLSRHQVDFEGPGGSYNRVFQIIAGITFARGKK